MTRPISTVLALLLIPTALASSAAAEAAAGHPYFPIGLGYAWRYQLTITGPDGESLTGTGTLAVGEVVERDGRSYFKVTAAVEGIPDAQQAPRYVRRGEDAVYARSETGATESVLLPTDVEVGQTWVDASNGFDMTMRVEAVEDVTVGETVYEDCLKVSGEGRPTEGVRVESTTWFAPDVGEVRSTIRFNGSVMDSQLIAHTRP